MFEGLISFCTPCRNRLHQLWQTLPENLNAMDGNCEYVVLDYGDEQRLKEFVNCFKDKRLRYVRHEADRYYHAHAKNAGNLASTGEVVINLDADYWIGPNLVSALRAKLTKSKSFYNVRNLPGFLGFWRNDFVALGGYDEVGFADGFWGYTDGDLRARALAAGYEATTIIARGAHGIRHGNSERLVDGQASLSSTLREHKRLSEENIKAGRLVANVGKPFGVIN